MVAVHDSILLASGPKKFQLLSKYFEEVIPWIEHGIRCAVLRHFLLIPTEAIAARLFAQAARLKDFPTTSEMFYMWVEGKVLEGLSRPNKEFSQQDSDSRKIQEEFNRLPISDRALLFIIVVEGCDIWTASKRTGLSTQNIEKKLSRIQKILHSKHPEFEFPESLECLLA
jgi:hypothetical protein